MLEETTSNGCVDTNVDDVLCITRGLVVSVVVTFSMNVYQVMLIVER